MSLAPQTYLSILTFLGLVLGFAGGAVSQLKKTSIDVDGTNEKRLTSFGKLALAISIIGFAGSFVFKGLNAISFRRFPMTRSSGPLPRRDGGHPAMDCRNLDSRLRE